MQSAPKALAPSVRCRFHFRFSFLFLLTRGELIQRDNDLAQHPALMRRPFFLTTGRIRMVAVDLLYSASVTVCFHQLLHPQFPLPPGFDASIVGRTQIPNVTSAVVPSASVTRIVKVDSPKVVGVPDITPVLAFSVRPFGSAPD